MSVSTGGSAYETWVHTLRTWADNPQTSLDHLPKLDEDTFSADTYGRLIKHLLDSVEAASKRWGDALQRAFQAATSPPELAAALVGLRPVLARRAQLASHPSLPEPVREALDASMRRDVERAQREIEESVRRQVAGARLETGIADQLLQVLRDNAFTTVLDRAYAPDNGRLEVAPLPEVERDEADGRRSFRTRRVVNAPLPSGGVS